MRNNYCVVDFSADNGGCVLNRLCKYCKWWERVSNVAIYGFCQNEYVHEKTTLLSAFQTRENFGCNFWEKHEQSENDNK